MNSATLELQGGTYTFANGLVISPNATVAGCGTVIGAITNNGTYTNFCGQSPTVSINSLTLTGNTVTVSFSSASGLNHTLEFKSSLGDAGWTPVPPALLGDGNLMNAPDPTATNDSRFYRIHVQ